MNFKLQILIKASYQYAKENGCAGLYTVGQNNNLNARLFYLACGNVMYEYDMMYADRGLLSGKRLFQDGTR